MTKTAIGIATDDDLILRYQEQAAIHGKLRNAKEATRAFDEAVAIWKEINRRGPKSVELFSHLMDSPNPAVRLSAAAKLLHLMPGKAEQVIEELTAEPKSIGLSAKMTLREWRAGRLKPLA